MHRRYRPAFLTLSALCLATIAQAQDAITFDDLSNLPSRNSSSLFAVANGNINFLDGVTFPSIFGVAGDLDTTFNSGVPFLMPHSGNYAGYAYQDTILTTSKLLSSVWLGNTSLHTQNDGVTAVTIKARNAANQVLGSVSVTGLTQAPTFVDTSAFTSLSGTSNYLFQVDSFGAADNPRFSLDDIRFTSTASVPEQSTVVTLLLGAGIAGIRLIALQGRRRRI